jgi:peptide/nickel transport system permease protein
VASIATADPSAIPASPPDEEESQGSALSLRTIGRLLWASGTGKASLALFLLMLGISVYVLVSYPNDFGTRRWSNPTLWADNPKTVPPKWMAWLGQESAAHRDVTLTAPTSSTQPGGNSAVKDVRDYAFTVRYGGDVPPSFLSVTIPGVTFNQRAPAVLITLARPDAAQPLRLATVAIPGPRTGEVAPYRRYYDTPERVLLTQQDTAVKSLQQLYASAYPGLTIPGDLSGRLDQALFGRPAADGSGRIEPLAGEYTLTVQVLVADVNDEVEAVNAVFGGTVYGWMGTDSIGRDLWEGLLYGFPIALLIGTLAAFLTTLVGASLGILSGYAGGKTDAIIQRVTDVISNVPVLPLLIFLVFVLGSNLWLMILALVAFSWTGLTILVRSMVLQIRSGQLVEAAKALGASRARIMVRHVFPQTAPFIVAQMIFSAPGAILAEASLSFIGLGDPSIPTWGQMLQAGFQTGALYVGFWWWVIPPGVLIIFTALAFMLLALAMEPIVDPRLRKVG